MNLETLRALIKTLEEEGVTANPRKAFKINEFTRKGLVGQLPGFSVIPANELLSITIRLLGKELTKLDLSTGRLVPTWMGKYSEYEESILFTYAVRSNREHFLDEAQETLDGLARSLEEQITIAQRFLANA